MLQRSNIRKTPDPERRKCPSFYRRRKARLSKKKRGKKEREPSF